MASSRQGLVVREERGYQQEVLRCQGQASLIVKKCDCPNLYVTELSSGHLPKLHMCNISHEYFKHSIWFVKLRARSLTVVLQESELV